MTTVTGTSFDISTPDGEADAYLSHPDDGLAHPGVLLFSDAVGLRPLVREMADRLASNGYTVLAPNVFYRLGRAPVFKSPDQLTPEENKEYMGAVVMPAVMALTPELVMRDAGVYLDTLAASEYTTDGPVGVTGYCLGAGFMLRTAGTYPDRVAAGGGFHGGFLATDAPDSPHLVADKVTAELFFGHADQDETLPPEQIERLNKALDAAGVRYQAEVYAGAPHGYTQADFAAIGRYSPEGTERHYRDLLALFDRNLH
jgi:carboxymethylenebutenolidase